MYLIKKSDPDNRNEVPTLSPYEQDLIRYSRSLSWQQEKDLVQRLTELKDQYWIFCDCGGSQPVIIICKAMDGNFYLRRQARTGHTLQCVFSHDDIKLSLTSSQSFMPSKKLKIFCPYQYAQNISTPSNRHVSHPHSSTIKKMGQLLYTIMTNAQFHQIDFGSVPKIINVQEDKSDEEIKKIKETHINSLREALGQINIFDKVSLKEFTHYSLSKESFRKARETLLNCQKSWPSHIKPFILFPNTAQEITLNTIKNKYKTIQPVSCIQTTSPWIDKQKSGPYLMLFSMILDEQQRDVFKDAFAIPIYSETIFMPLESNYERQVLNIIFDVIEKFPDKKYIKLEKPLFCYKTPDKQKYRPDFIIYGKLNQSIFIEVLGSHQEDYLSHKQTISNIAGKYCTYNFCVKAYDDKARQEEYDMFEQQLSLCLEQIV